MQIPFRYNPLVGIPPRIRTGYYYLPSGYYGQPLAVMVLFHGLEGYGLSIMYAGTPNQGDQSTFQVRNLRNVSRGKLHEHTLNYQKFKRLLKSV